jgi:DNA-nicking Smr family endonuclease
VRVIHGKGRHSEGGTGVLADLVVETLTSEIIGFAILALRSEFSPDGRPASLTVLLSNPATGR